MSLDEQVRRHADAIVLNSNIIEAELLAARAAALSLAGYDNSKRVTAGALGAIKIEVMRALQAGLFPQLEAELKRRGYGARNDAKQPA